MYVTVADYFYFAVYCIHAEITPMLNELVFNWKSSTLTLLYNFRGG